MPPGDHSSFDKGADMNVFGVVQRIAFALLVSCALTPAASAQAGAASTLLRFQQERPSVTILDQAADGCDNKDAPDVPAMAFRNARNEIVLYSSSYRNVPLVGPSLTTLRKSCRAAFEAAQSPDPARLDDRTWINGLFTIDGVNIFAVGSASYMPYRHGATCNAGRDRTDCWYNGIVGLQSTNGGVSFRYFRPPPDHVILKPDDGYDPNTRQPRGYTWTTNFVPFKGYVYSLVRVRTANEKSKMCLMRFPAQSPWEWEYWSGSTFAPVAGHDKNACATIGGANFPARGLYYHEKRRLWLAIYDTRTPKDPKGRGVYFRVSRDMINWGEPQLLKWFPLDERTKRGASFLVAYPALLDETSPDRNFGIVGDHLSLLHVEAYTATTGQTLRKLVATPFRALD